jgi:hypothetical protein
MSLAYIRACQRVCTYCKKEGHVKPNCPVAFKKCEEIQDGAHIILHSGRRVEERLFNLFNSEKLTDLCFLMNTRGTREFISALLQDNDITEAEAKMHFKRDRVKILMWKYWFSTEKCQELQARKANKITVKTPENVTDLSEFECPICVTELPAKEKVEPGCKHCVCKNCFVSCLEHQILNMNYLPPKCSMCRTNFKELTITNPEYLDEVTELTNVM